MDLDDLDHVPAQDCKMLLVIGFMVPSITGRVEEFH